MPFNGAGVYVPPSSPGAFNPAASGSSATPAAWNALLADFTTAFSTCITKDGQTTLTAPGALSLSSQLGQSAAFETGAVAIGVNAIPIPLDDTIPQSNEGDEFLTLPFTPLSATSQLYITVTFFGGSAAATLAMIAGLFQDALPDALAAGAVTGVGNTVMEVSYTHVVVAASTSARTYRVRAGGNAAGATTFNGVNGGRLLGGVFASSITIREVLA